VSRRSRCARAHGLLAGTTRPGTRA
jgi:hypothetical protein